MSDKLLDIIAMVGAGAVIYLVAENNVPAISTTIKKAISNIHSTILSPSTHTTPVSTEASSPDIGRMTCPPGTYLDQTLGIYHCHSAHKTHELAPANVTNQWENAYGDDFTSRSSQDWLYDEEGYAYASPPLIPSPSPNQTLAPPKPEPQTLIGPITVERHPSRIKKSVNDRIDEQKKSKKKDRKLAEVPKSSGDIHTQVECAKDLKTMKCDSNCYKDGKLWMIVCSESALYPSSDKKAKKLTIPANFPSDVTVTPTGDEPYPEDTTPTEGPQQDIPPLQLAPGQDQQQILPTIPPTTPGRGPTQTTPPQTITTTPSPSSCSAVGSSSPTQNKNFTDGCGHGNDKWISSRAGIGTGPNGNTTPESGNQKVPVSTLIKNSQHFHAIYHFKTGIQTGSKGQPIGAEVTGGYCGSNDSVPQVGITIGVNGKGQIIRRTEDHYKQHNVGGDYNELTPEGATQQGAVGSIPEFSSNLGNKDFYIIWCADKDGSTVTYRGYVRVGNKEYQIANLVNPKEGGGSGFAGHHDSRTKIIDFTEEGHNTYLRGRHNNLGTICPTGSLYPCRYQPSANTTKGFAYQGSSQEKEEKYLYRGPLGYIPSNPSLMLSYNI